MADKELPTGPGPQDPFTLADELEAYLHAIVDSEESYDDSLTEEDLKVMEQERERMAQIGSALTAHGVDLGLEEGQTLSPFIEADITDVLISERRYLAGQICLGLDYSQDSGSYEFMGDAIAKIIANRHISVEEKSAYMASIVDIIGEEEFEKSVEDMELRGSVEVATEAEADFEARSYASQTIYYLYKAGLLAKGISPDHDDFDRFCSNLTRLQNYLNDGLPDSITTPLRQRLREQATRLGVLDLFEL